MNPFHHIQFVFFDNSFVYHLCQETSPWIFHLPFRQRGLVWKKVKKCCSGEARLCRKQLQVIPALRACVWLNDKLMFSEREGLFGSRCFQVRLGKKSGREGQSARRFSLKTFTCGAHPEYFFIDSIKINHKHTAADVA